MSDARGIREDSQAWRASRLIVTRYGYPTLELIPCEPGADVSEPLTRIALHGGRSMARWCLDAWAKDNRATVQEVVA